MKATELRIGNYVYDINRRSEIHLPDYNPYKVLQIELFNTEILPIEQNPATVEKWFKITNEDLSPIPLAEEWLLKLGFEKTEVNNGVIKQYYHDCTPPKYRNEHGLFFRFGEMRNEKYKMYWYASGAVNSSMHSFPCEYVHQLQNLYFALTGNELQ
jgi:hypothetical protein